MFCSEDYGFARADPKQLPNIIVNYQALTYKHSDVWKVACLVCFPALQLSPLYDPDGPADPQRMQFPSGALGVPIVSW